MGVSEVLSMLGGLLSLKSAALWARVFGSETMKSIPQGVATTVFAAFAPDVVGGAVTVGARACDVLAPTGRFKVVAVVVRRDGTRIRIASPHPPYSPHPPPPSSPFLPSRRLLRELRR